MFSRILLVEDDPETAKCFSRLLTMTGYYVRVAEGFRSATILAREDQFDLLVCDIGLPDGSGLDLMRVFSSQYRMRGVAISGYGEPNDVADCVAAGFCTHILKPATFDRMNAAIQRCLPRAGEPLHTFAGV